MFTNNIRFVAIPLIFWGFSGFFLLIKDYYIRKKKLFLKLLWLNRKRDPVKHSIYLRSTICGLCLLWALKEHTRKLYKGEEL